MLRKRVSHRHPGSEGDVGKVVWGALVLQDKFQSRDAGPGVAPKNVAAPWEGQAACRCGDVPWP